MHRVLHPVWGSLTPKDPYQDLVLDPRVKFAYLSQKAVHYKKKPVTEVAGPASL